MTDFSIAWPAVLLLLPLPWLARRYLKPSGALQHEQLRLPIEADWIPQQVQGRAKTNMFDLIWLTIAWLLLILALCRPQFLGPPMPVTQAGRDLMMAVDTSQSMLEEDFEINGQVVNRLIAVQAIASKFIEERKQDRIGLILFGDVPYLQSPLTFDHSSLNTLLMEAFAGMAGGRTAIGDTIGMAVKTLQDQPAESRVLILLTDGENTSGQLSPEAATELAQEIDLKIYTIGIGADPNDRLSKKFDQMFGNRSTLTQFLNMQNGPAPIDESSLKAIAQATGGKFFRAKETAELREIYGIIDALERREDESEFLRPAKDLFFWPLLASILMLLIYLSERHTTINWRPWRA